MSTILLGSGHTAVMQPTYLPWCGYFELISSVDTFVILDDVQLSRPSWQTRNRILNSKGVQQWLSLDVARTHGGEPPFICEALLDETHGWRAKHLRAISLNYAKAPFLNVVLGLLEPILLGPEVTVGRLNSEIISAVCALLGVSTPVRFSSEMSISGTREERLLDICRLTSADTFVSAPGSADYLEDDHCQDLFVAQNVMIQYQDFSCCHYSQGASKDFFPRLSFVDHLAWLGPNGFKSHISTSRGSS